MSSELRVDKIVPTDGVSNGGGGGIIQVCQSTKQDAQTININSTAAQDIAGTDQNGNGSVFCVKIAPKLQAVKYYFHVISQWVWEEVPHIYNFFMVRNSTILLPSTHGTGNMVNATFGLSGTGSSYYTENMSFMFLDSPNSTSELTYKVQMGKGDGGYVTYINRPETLDNYPYNTCGSSTLTVMEVSA